MDACFFDVDGTLHRGDIFEDYVRSLALSNMPRTIAIAPLLLVALSVHVLFPDGKHGINLILFLLTFGKGRRELDEFESEFVDRFKSTLRPFPDVVSELSRRIRDGHPVYLVSGSPEHLVKRIYPQLESLECVLILGTSFKRAFGANLIEHRCVCTNKLWMLEGLVGGPLSLHSGYSDSDKDLSVMQVCRNRYRVGKEGVIAPWR